LPLADPAVIDAAARFHLAGGYDYSSNTLHPTFPMGSMSRYAVMPR